MDISFPYQQKSLDLNKIKPYQRFRKNVTGLYLMEMVECDFLKGSNPHLQNISLDFEEK